MNEPEDRDGAQRPLEELFLEHGAGLAGAVRGILGRGADVQEVLQQAFLQAFEAERKGRCGADRVAWLFVVTMNAARDALRRTTRRRRALPVEEVDPVELPATHAETGPHPQAERGEWLAAARAAVERLRDGEKEVFLLRVAADRPFPAIARELGIPEGTAKTRMRAALQHLRHALRTFAPPAAGRAGEVRSTEDGHGRA